MKRPILAILLISSTLLLASCESLEERAEGHYQAALVLIAEGDVDRAMVELRNAFDLDNSHFGARSKMAELQLDRGNRRGAYRQYLRIAETDPDDVDSRIMLSELAFVAGDWDELDRHGARVAELDAENPLVQVIVLIRDYRAAIEAEDEQKRRILAHQASQTLGQLPESVLLHTTLMDNALRVKDYTTALQEIEWMISYDPTNPSYYQERLRVFATLDDVEGVERQLKELVTLFPDDPTNLQTLIRFYVSRDRIDAAEQVLRDSVDDFGLENSDAVVYLLTFLNEFRGPDAVRAEIQKAIETSPNPVQFRILEANLDFSLGQTPAAIAILQDVLAEAEPSEETNDVKIRLAQMQLSTGDEAAARAHVSDVLAAQETHPAALKMLAAWQIEADEVNDAINNLRTALDQDPRDAGAMTLIGNAYVRTGRAELARDFWAQAVSASGNAPAETLFYARLLISDGNFLAAEDILLSALRLDPSNVELLTVTGDLYMNMENYDRVRAVSSALERVGGEQATTVSNRLETERLRRQEGVDSALAFLEGLASSDDATTAAQIDLVKAKIRLGELEEALEFARDLAADDPENAQLALLLASAERANGNVDATKEIFRRLLEEDPKRDKLWLELSSLEIRLGNRDAAKLIVEEGLTHTPESPELLWARASYLERDGKIDEAIDIYQLLYQENTSSVLMANNLASHLSSSRQDEESLERAWVIAQRLRDTPIPAFKDTYGWILHRRGDTQEALRYLEEAAQEIPNDPIVQYHLGKVFVALGRPVEALEQFRKAVELAASTDTRPQIEDARDLAENLVIAPAEDN